jgi:D-psicose/D-tagatose/L-ribulose 3-epimerase
MKYGMNLLLWTGDMHDGMMPVLESIKEMGYDGVELPMFDLTVDKWAHWGKRLDEPGCVDSCQGRGAKQTGT